MHLTSHLSRQHDTLSCIDINPQDVSLSIGLFSRLTSSLKAKTSLCFLPLSSVVSVFHFRFFIHEQALAS